MNGMALLITGTHASSIYSARELQKLARAAVRERGGCKYARHWIQVSAEDGGKVTLRVEVVLPSNWREVINVAI